MGFQNQHNAMSTTTTGFPPLDAEIYRLAAQTAAADAEWRRISDAMAACVDRLAGPALDDVMDPLSDEVMAARGAHMKRLKQHPDYPRMEALERDFDDACTRHFDLEYKTRTTPAHTLAGILFKLEHLAAGSLWEHEEPGVKGPIDQTIADLERTVAT